MRHNQPVVPVVATSKSAGHASNQQKWSKPTSFFKDRRRQQTGGDGVPQTGLVRDMQTMRLHDVRTVLLFRAAEKAGYYDDGDFLLERLIQFLHKLPRHSRKGKMLTDAFITKLWSTLDHPQPKAIPTLMGHANRHRTADGSNSNPYLPTLGAAGTPYARAVTPMDVQSPDMPDAGLVFDTLMARGDATRPHPCGLSSMMFYLAAIITHDIFQTDGRNGGINAASSYLDLAPLYGNTLDEQNSMRQFKDGLLKPDCFAHKRILTFPPACCVFLLMFSRFHNYVVTQLARINEANRFNKPDSPPESKDPAAQQAWKQYDEDLFQTGRLVTCGLYVNIILKDYVRAILSLNRTDSTWTIDPRTNMDRHAQKDPAPTGVGNQVSVEFNLLYRWHSIISERDAEWTASEMRRLLGGKDPETATFHEMITAFQVWEASISPDPHQRKSVPTLERQPDGTYSDDSLVDILSAGIEDPAGSFGANSVPRCMRPVEMLGILQARRWRVATLNEFRAFIGLTRHRTFEDINPDPAVAAGLAALYGSPANVELYPGLVSERTKPPMAPGSGVCVGYTASRAILSDAVSLVRGDRFYTDDFTPKNLTNWGYAEVDSDLDVDSGNVMYKLIFGAFPSHFERDSVYAHHPLVIPEENRIIFAGLGKESKYSWTRPARRPADNKESLETVFDSMNPTPSDESGSKPFPTGGIQSFMQSTTRELLASHSHDVRQPEKSTRGVNVVGDVISLAFVRLTAEMFGLPLSRSGNGKQGEGYTDAQLWTILSVLHAANSTALSPGRSYELRNQAKDITQQFNKTVNKVQRTSSMSRAKQQGLRGQGQRMQMQQMQIAHGQNKSEAVGQLTSLLAWSAMVPVRLLSESLNHHLDQGPEHMAMLRGLAVEDNADKGRSLMNHLLEGMDSKHVARNGASKEANGDVTSDSAAQDVVLGLYFPRGPGRPHDGNLKVYAEAMLAQFRVLVSLPGLRRADGLQGRLKKVSWTPWNGQVGRQPHGENMEYEDVMYMTSDRTSFWPVPTAMNVSWSPSA